MLFVGFAARSTVLAFRSMSDRSARGGGFGACRSTARLHEHETRALPLPFELFLRQLCQLLLPLGLPLFDEGQVRPQEQQDDD